MSVTRASSELYGLGAAIHEDDCEIRERKLPSYGKVLRSFMAYYSKENVKGPASKNKAAKATFEQVKIHYERACVPLQLERNCVRMIKKLY